MFGVNDVRAAIEHFEAKAVVLVGEQTFSLRMLLSAAAAASATAGARHAQQQRCIIKRLATRAPLGHT